MIISTARYSEIENRLDTKFYHPERFIAIKKIKKYLTTIGDFFESYNKQEKPEGGEEINLVELKNVIDFRIFNIQLVKKYQIGSNKKLFANNDVLISRLLDHSKIALVQSDEFEDENKNLCSTEFIVLRNKKKGVPSEFLYFYLQTDIIQTIFKYTRQGTLHPRISEKFLLSLPIPIKSIDFVNKIRELEQKYKKVEQKYKEAEQKYKEVMYFFKSSFID